jgi:hypothetical protein
MDEQLIFAGCGRCHVCRTVHAERSNHSAHTEPGDTCDSEHLCKECGLEQLRCDYTALKTMELFKDLVLDEEA